MNHLTKELMVRGSFAGLISGLFLGLFLKVIQHQFGIEVYTLLLNVDYIPVLKEMKFPEIIEISFHLLISIVLGIFLLFVVKKYQWTNWKMVMIIDGHLSVHRCFPLSNHSIIISNSITYFYFSVFLLAIRSHFIWGIVKYFLYC